MFCCFNGAYTLCNKETNNDCINSKYNEINQCFDYNLDTKNSSDIFPYYFGYCNNFESIFIKDTNEYILICNPNSKGYIHAYKIKGNNINDFKSISFSFNNCKNIYNISLIYNSSNKEYDIISDCFDFQNKWNIIYIKSVFQNSNDFSNQSSSIILEPLLINTSILSTIPLTIQSSSSLLNSIEIYDSTLSKESITIESSLLYSYLPITIPISEESTIINDEKNNNNEDVNVFNGNKDELINDLTNIIN